MRKPITIVTIILETVVALRSTPMTNMVVTMHTRKHCLIAFVCMRAIFKFTHVLFNRYNKHSVHLLSISFILIVNIFGKTTPNTSVNSVEDKL